MNGLAQRWQTCGRRTCCGGPNTASKGKFGPDAADATPIVAALAGGQVEGNRFPEDAEIREAAREALERLGKSRPVDPAERV